MVEKIKIYIDDKELKLNQNFKSLGGVINFVNKQLEKKERMIKNIYVNGNELEDDDIVSTSDLDIIEFSTKTYSDLLVESLMKSKEYINQFFDILYEITDESYSLDLDKNSIEDLYMFLMWILEVVLMMHSKGMNDYLEEDFITVVEEFKYELDLAIEAYNEGDVSGFLNVLSFSIVDILEKFYANIDNYIEAVVEDEKRKKMNF